MYFTDVTQHIVYSNPLNSYMMTYDSILGLHSIWKTRKALEQVFKRELLIIYLNFNEYIQVFLHF